MRGRCSSSCVIVGGRTTTSTPAAQPKRTIDATPKTKESETPGSIPSTGTGKRSAKVDAARSATRPISVVVLCCESANETAPASVTARPARQTGATTARSRGGGSWWSTSPLPVQIQYVAPTADDGDREERKDSDEHEQAGSPLQHRQPPSRWNMTSAILEARPGCCIPRTGET